MPACQSPTENSFKSHLDFSYRFSKQDYNQSTSDFLNLDFSFWGGGQLKKSQKKSKSISGILGWVLTFFDPKF